MFFVIKYFKKRDKIYIILKYYIFFFFVFFYVYEFINLLDIDLSFKLLKFFKLIVIDLCLNK